jgi:hypothetical protein
VAEKFFETIRGGFSLHVDGEDVYTSTHFALARFGESPDRVLEVFYQENPTANFMLVPLFAYGLPPRRELCTQQSLTSALQSVAIEPGSTVEQAWKALAEEFDIAWPRRLQRLSSPKPAPNAEMQP